MGYADTQSINHSGTSLFWGWIDNISSYAVQHHPTQHIHHELEGKVHLGDQSESRASGPPEPSPKPNEKKCSHQPKKSKTQ